MTLRPLTSTLTTLATLLALAAPARAAWRDDFPLGYDADSRFYFHRQRSFDNTLQLGADAGWALYGVALLRAEDYRRAADFDPAARQRTLGVMAERNFFNAYTAVSAGLAYMTLSTYMFGWPMSRGSGYVVTAAGDSRVDYALASNVTTTTSYLSLPVEAKYELMCDERFGVYVKGALRTSVSLATRTHFDAPPGATAEEKQQLESFFKNTRPLFVNANAYFGLRFGTYDEGNFRVELGIPLPLTGEMANLHLRYGLALRVSYCLPISLFSR